MSLAQIHNRTDCCIALMDRGSVETVVFLQRSIHGPVIVSKCVRKLVFIESSKLLLCLAPDTAFKKG